MITMVNIANILLFFTNYLCVKYNSVLYTVFLICLHCHQYHIPSVPIVGVNPNISKRKTLYQTKPLSELLVPNKKKHWYRIVPNKNIEQEVMTQPKMPYVMSSSFSSLSIAVDIHIHSILFHC